MKKLIRVVIPTYNRKDVLLNAVNSVLNQQKSEFDYEIIISDDGSSDRTSELFKRNKNKRIRYFFFKENAGVNVARNRGIAKAKGEYVIFLDSDDVMVPYCFSVISEYERAGKLSKVNLFSTAEIKTGRLMSVVPQERNYTYQEWLSGALDGEFLQLVERSVLKKDLFDEERFCFERFFWNRVIKKHGAFASPKVMRLYSFDAENRVSRKLIDPAYASRRFTDWKEYLKRFGKDYLEFGLLYQYSDLLIKVGLFGILSKEVKQGRKYLRDAMHASKSFKLIVLCVLSLFGYRVTRAAYLFIVRRQEH